MNYEPRRRHRRRNLRPLIFAGLGVLLLLIVGEAYRAYAFYSDLTESRTILLSLKSDLDVKRLSDSQDEMLSRRERLEEASGRLSSAASFVKTDPFVNVGRLVPVIGRQPSALRTLVLAADEAAKTGVDATDVALAFSRFERDPSRTSIEDALRFLEAQKTPMTAVGSGLDRLEVYETDLPEGRLFGPLANAKTDLSEAVDRLGGLVEGYKTAEAFLPEILGMNGERRYLVLPQNDTELFPSGGLISSYGIATFNEGRLGDMNLEYFGTLFDRWQRDSGGEYVEPPAPLKRYLKRDYSWALGEAGWYPDFPTTAGLAQSFVEKGGAPPTDGAIAVDLQFLGGLLALFGSVDVPSYGVSVTPDNVNELTLELTRDEGYVPGQERKAFLSHLAAAVLDRLHRAPKEQWIDLLALLDRMGEERHLQLYFADERMQALSELYGFDGRLVETDGDFLNIADTSVNSTKLNMILDTRVRLDLLLSKEGTARSLLTYEIANPFPEWKNGRDPGLVRLLMLEGVYGSYLRVYVPKDAKLQDVRLAGRSVGAEQAEVELDHQMFGRFFPVLPGATANLQVMYDSPAVVEKLGGGHYRYKLYLQKEAGTAAHPLQINLALPKQGQIEELMLDGKPLTASASVTTDLRTDRQLEVVFRAP